MVYEAPLGEREAAILQAVVHTYITTAEAVGSRSIVKRFGFDWSPATVRNVMSDLEEAGYLQQLHTSSGRVPTDRGYRYYVDYLMRIQDLTLAERARIERQLTDRLNDADEVMRQTSHMLALVSHQTGLVTALDRSDAEVRHIELVPISPARVAIMVVDSYGVIRTETGVLDETSLTMDDCARVSRFLNEHLRGVQADQMAREARARMQTMLGDQRELAEKAVRVLDLLPPARPGSLFMDGATQLFEQPEFHDVAKAREVFAVLDERDRLADLLRGRMRSGGVFQTSVLIGSESHEHGLSEISVVASPFRVGEKPVGVVGILGPRRMPYSRLTALVDYTAGMLSRLLTRLAG